MQQDVNLDAFSRPGPRSSTCILVKNLPYATTASSLQTLFAPHGTISRLLVPPSGTIAIVEMADKDSAQKAWRALVYKQFGGSVLYLEKAPAAIWSGGAAKADKNNKDDAAVLPVVAANSVRKGTATTSAGSESDAAPGATLFLKNLNFATTTPRLRAAFDHLDGFVFARVQTKPDPNRPGETLSMGFGFAGFKTPAQAQRAKEAQAGMVLDGHEIEINFAKRDTDKVGGRGGGNARTTTTAAAGKESSTKLLVKNVPFEATRNDLRQLFGCVHNFSHLLPLIFRSVCRLGVSHLTDHPSLLHTTTEPTGNSSLSVSPARWTTRRAVSPSSSLPLAATPNPRSRRSNTPTCSDGTWSSSGPGPRTASVRDRDRPMRGARRRSTFRDRRGGPRPSLPSRRLLYRLSVKGLPATRLSL